MLDGVYRRGEFYLRWMQRLSSLGFGTGVGRFLTRFAVVPFGGAFVTLAFVHAMRGNGSPATRPGSSLDAGRFCRGMICCWGCSCCVWSIPPGSAGRRSASSRVVYRVFRAVPIEPIRWVIQSPLAAAGSP